MSPPEVQATGMLVVALIGMAVNLVSMRMLRGIRAKLIPEAEALFASQTHQRAPA